MGRIMADNEHDDETRLFREMVGPVRRVRHDRVEPPRTRPAPDPHKTREDEQQVLADMLSDEFEPEDLETGDELLFARPGLQHRVLRKLRRGHYCIEAEMDLHGMTVTMARTALVQFLERSRKQHFRCVRVVHGKGLGSHNRGPVLKNMTNKWLRQRDEVLAFCSARAAHGGTGAVYVLLKRG